jgi:hypothetical protein
MRRVQLWFGLLVALFTATAHAGWPGANDYKKAIGAGGNAVFSDPALRGGTLKRNKIG